MFVDNWNSLFGQRIRRLRDAKGQTQQALAESADISLKNFGEIERGRGNPSLKQLQGIATALGVSLSELFDTEQEEKPDDALRAEIITRLDTAKPEVLRVIHRALKP
jgi:XRE family aerobic/anaerobic benzoate catabolism transcriptional regulator